MNQNLTSKIKNLQQHSGLMKYFKNTSWFFGEKILRMVVGLFISFTTLGLYSIVMRELINNKQISIKGENK